MKIYNTLNNRKEDFVPVTPNHVKMYVCGPTVYNYIHIGNARPVIFFDTVRRYLEHRDYKVNFVSNFTDVDDKIIAKAIELQVTEKEVTDKFITAFLQDVKKVNSSIDYTKPRVTNYMDHIIDYINILVQKDFAYVVDGDVYFRVTNVENYGKLSNRNVEDLISGSRVDINVKKENPLDFTLWKKTEIGIKFESPWGLGRPGWHTECVAMIDDIFKQQIDIHGGGSGLMFPHHENEIAQSMVLNNHSLARYWMHNGLLNIGGNKMSKSEGEVVLVKDLTVDPNAFRLFTLSTYYRSPITYTDEALDVYVKEWEKVKRIYSSLFLKLDLEDGLYNNSKIDPDLLKIYKNLLASMDNDFNTANAITSLQDLVKISNQMLRNKTENSVLLSSLKLFNDFFDILGLKFTKEPLSIEDKETYKLWNKARSEKDFDSADIYRNKLQVKGII